MLFRATPVWLLLVVLAVANGFFRNAVVTPRVGDYAGHLISSVLLAAAIVAVSWRTIRWIRPGSARRAWRVGIFWVAMTIAFEFLAGHFLFGNPWSKLFADYNLAAGRVWSLVLVTTLVSPAWAWRRRSRPRCSSTEPGLIERFMPTSDVTECHETIVRAPADLVFDVARSFDLLSMPIIRMIVAMRARAMGAKQPRAEHPEGFVAEAKAMGWGQLAERPRRELVFGAVTKPWEADVTFVPVPPDEFLRFSEPGRVKIAWTLEVIPMGEAVARFRTQTRALATDAAARAKFRRYWRWAGFGIVAIRLLFVPAIRRRAERLFAERGRVGGSG